MPTRPSLSRNPSTQSQRGRPPSRTASPRPGIERRESSPLRTMATLGLLAAGSIMPGAQAAPLGRTPSFNRGSGKMAEDMVNARAMLHQARDEYGQAHGYLSDAPVDWDNVLDWDVYNERTARSVTPSPIGTPDSTGVFGRANPFEYQNLLDTMTPPAFTGDADYANPFDKRDAQLLTQDASGRLQIPQPLRPNAKGGQTTLSPATPAFDPPSRYTTPIPWPTEVPVNVQPSVPAPTLTTAPSPAPTLAPPLAPAFPAPEAQKPLAAPTPADVQNLFQGIDASENAVAILWHGEQEQRFSFFANEGPYKPTFGAFSSHTVKPNEPLTVKLPKGWSGRLQKMSGFSNEPATWNEMTFDGFEGMTFFDVSYIRGNNGNAVMRTVDNSAHSGVTKNVFADAPASIKTTDNSGKPVIKDTEGYDGTIKFDVIDWYRKVIPEQADAYIRWNDDLASKGTKEKHMIVEMWDV